MQPTQKAARLISGRSVKVTQYGNQIPLDNGLF